MTPQERDDFVDSLCKHLYEHTDEWKLEFYDSKSYDLYLWVNNEVVSLAVEKTILGSMIDVHYKGTISYENRTQVNDVNYYHFELTDDQARLVWDTIKNALGPVVEKKEEEVMKAVKRVLKL